MTDQWLHLGGMSTLDSGLCPYCRAWLPTLSSLMEHTRERHPAQGAVADGLREG
jgi:hypothetical protein